MSLLNKMMSDLIMVILFLYTFVYCTFCINVLFACRFGQTFLLYALNVNVYWHNKLPNRFLSDMLKYQLLTTQVQRLLVNWYVLTSCSIIVYGMNGSVK